jgi:hypothetical protein
MNGAGWEITRMELTTAARKYGFAAVHSPWHVQGINHHDGGRPFYWNVPTIARPDYDPSNATTDEPTAAAAIALACRP